MKFCRSLINCLHPIVILNVAIGVQIYKMVPHNLNRMRISPCHRYVALESIFVPNKFGIPKPFDKHFCGFIKRHYLELYGIKRSTRRLVPGHEIIKSFLKPNQHERDVPEPLKIQRAQYTAQSRCRDVDISHVLELIYNDEDSISFIIGLSLAQGRDQI